MRLYLDDDSVDRVLIRLLRQAGHDVAVPTDLGIAGEADPVHLRHAIREQRALLSQNYEDFRLLHELLLEAQGHHPGILMVRQESNPKAQDEASRYRPRHRQAQRSQRAGC